jgi:hypothetical protein
MIEDISMEELVDIHKKKAKTGEVVPMSTDESILILLSHRSESFRIQRAEAVQEINMIGSDYTEG